MFQERVLQVYNGDSGLPDDGQCAPGSNPHSQVPWAPSCPRRQQDIYRGRTALCKTCVVNTQMF